MPYKFIFPLLFLVSTSATHLYAQSYPGSRPVSCQLENISFSDFFRIVFTQTKIKVFYNEEHLKNNERISVNVLNEPLDNVLALLIRKRGMGWCYKNETLIISSSRKGEAERGELPEDKRRIISGIVVNEKREPLEGVLIIAKDTSNRANTDKNGRFVLDDLEK